MFQASCDVGMARTSKRVICWVRMEVRGFTREQYYNMNITPCGFTLTQIHTIYIYNTDNTDNTDNTYNINIYIYIYIYIYIDIYIYIYIYILYIYIYIYNKKKKNSIYLKWHFIGHVYICMFIYDSLSEESGIVQWLMVESRYREMRV